MADVELIDFTIPVGGGHVLQLSAVPGPAGRDSLWLHLHTVYSQYGLLYQVPVRLGAGLLGISWLPGSKACESRARPGRFWNRSR